MLFLCVTTQIKGIIYKEKKLQVQVILIAVCQERVQNGKVLQGCDCVIWDTSIITAFQQ